jgi:hypothetical protein
LPERSDDDEVANLPGEWRIAASIGIAPFARHLSRFPTPVMLPAIPQHADRQVSSLLGKLVKTADRTASHDEGYGCLSGPHNLCIGRTSWALEGQGNWQIWGD